MRRGKGQGARGKGKEQGVKGAFAKEKWVGGKEIGESVMDNKICEMEIGQSGWERRDRGKGRKGKAKSKKQGNRARGQ